MGNVSSISGAGACGRVVLRDGSVREFDEPLTAAELMMEHPQQVVVEIQSAVAGKRPTPLPADKKLDFKKVYLMVPVRGGKPPALSPEEIRRVLLCANSVLRSRFLLSSSKLLPCFARISPAAAGAGKRTVLIEEIGEGERSAAELVPESIEVRPEYLSRQLSGKGWKPGLETIKEKKMERKLSHWLFKY